MREGNKYRMEVPVNAFYNEIASGYESRLSEQDHDTRMLVQDIFTNKVRGGDVMDFGGGTGLDLPWLSANYNVYFLEPSSRMKEIALHVGDYGGRVHFLHTGLDFRQWSMSNLPVPHEMDAVLLNFSVVNCILDIRMLFSKLALVCKQDALVFVVALKEAPVRLRRVKQLIGSITGKPIVFYNDFSGLMHRCFLHAGAQIERCCNPYFELQNRQRIEESGFIMYILRRL